MGRKRSSENDRLGQYLQRKSGGTIELRYPIPADVQHAFLDDRGRPRRMIIRSLGTPDIRLANAKGDVLRAIIRKDIEGAKSARTSPNLNDYVKSLFDAEMERFTQELKADEPKKRNAMFARRADLEPPANASFSDAMAWVDRTIDLRPRSVEQAEDRRMAWGRALMSSDVETKYDAAGWAADHFFERVTGRQPDRQSPEYIAVLDRCATVLVDALVVQNDLDRGRPASPTQDPALKPAPTESEDGNVATSERGKFPLSRYFEENFAPSLDQGRAVYGERTKAGKRLSVRLFGEIIGDKPIFMITKSDLWEFHDRLLEHPDPRTLTKAHRALKANELIGLAKVGSIKSTLLNAKTVNRHITGIKTLLDYAEKRRDIRLSIAKGVRAEIDYEEETGRSFTTDELNRIFTLPLFAGCQEGKVEGGLFKAGPVKIRDDRFWIPLVLFLTGGRSSEIVGLSCADVFPDHEVPHILIQPNELRRLKNKPSKRMVPIHPYLKQIGFLEFARDRLRKAGTPQFFAMAEQKLYRDSATGTVEKKALSNTLIMRQFNRTHLAHADANRDGGSVKCFRNTFEQETLASIESDEIRRRLTGRKVDSTVTVYTQNIPDDHIKRTELLRHLDTNMGKIMFQNVDLSHLTR